MGHLIETIRDSSIDSAVELLEQTHLLLVDCATVAQTQLSTGTLSWGINIKRLEVPLPNGLFLIGKPKEKLVEIINILATAERTISALKWLSHEFPFAKVRECHPSTSDDAGGNDIVLTDFAGNVLVLCEVCDVASSSADQNKKENKDLKNLGCETTIPNDLVKRYIATSCEFAKALSSPKRRWNNRHYRYALHSAGDSDKTVMLEIKVV